MIKKLKQYTPEFKAKVALAALRNEASIAKIGDGIGTPMLFGNRG